MKCEFCGSETQIGIQMSCEICKNDKEICQNCLLLFIEGVRKDMPNNYLNLIFTCMPCKRDIKIIELLDEML